MQCQEVRARVHACTLRCCHDVCGRLWPPWRQPQLQPTHAARCMGAAACACHHCVHARGGLPSSRPLTWWQAVASGAAAAAAAAGGDAPRNTPALLAAMSDAVAASEAFAGADCGAAAARAAAVAVELGQQVQAPQELW